jgi:DNA-binding NarL/FixJ family response regulator
MKQALNTYNNKKKFRIAFLEDHLSLRIAMTTHLEATYNISIVVSAGDGEAFLQQLGQLDELPDLCMVDLLMEGMNGIEVIAFCKEKWPDLKFIVLTAFEWNVNRYRCIHLGIKGFFLKTELPDRLYKGIKDIIEKGAMDPSPFDEKLITKAHNAHLVKGLKPLDYIVIRSILQYPTLKDAADSLKINHQCLQSRCQRLYITLNISNKQELLKLSICYGWIRLDNLDHLETWF